MSTCGVFLPLAAALFAVYSLVSNGQQRRGGKIVVTQGQLSSVWEGFTSTRQREPIPEEYSPVGKGFGL